jgi:hypothetical protein
MLHVHLHAACPCLCCMSEHRRMEANILKHIKRIEANIFKRIEANWSEVNKRIFWSELKRIEANISFFRFAFVSIWILWSELKRIEANIFVWTYTNQSEYSPNKTLIRFDSLYSKHLKEANMGLPSQNRIHTPLQWLRAYQGKKLPQRIFLQSPQPL